MWLVEITGYAAYAKGSPKLLEQIEAKAGQLGVQLGWFAKSEELSSFINTLPPGQVASLQVFSHGIAGEVHLRHGWSGTEMENYGLTAADLQRIRPQVFSKSVRIDLEACNSATKTTFSPSLLEHFWLRFGGIATGWEGRTSYRDVNLGIGGVRESRMFSSTGFDPNELVSQLRGRFPQRVTLGSGR